MKKLVVLHFIFFLVAIFIALVLIPLDKFYINNATQEEISAYYKSAFTFEKRGAWQHIFIWFLGLSCGRLMLKALTRGPLNK